MQFRRLLGAGKFARERYRNGKQHRVGKGNVHQKPFLPVTMPCCVSEFPFHSRMLFCRTKGQIPRRTADLRTAPRFRVCIQNNSGNRVKSTYISLRITRVSTSTDLKILGYIMNQKMFDLEEKKTDEGLSKLVISPKFRYVCEMAEPESLCCACIWFCCRWVWGFFLLTEKLK